MLSANTPGPSQLASLELDETLLESDYAPNYLNSQSYMQHLTVNVDNFQTMSNGFGLHKAKQEKAIKNGDI